MGEWRSLAAPSCSSGYFQEGVIPRIPTRGVSSITSLPRPPASMGLDTSLVIGVGNYHAASGTYDQDAQFYMLQGNEWVLLQTIATQGVRDVELWTIGSEVFAGVANHYSTTVGSGYSQTSRVYKWNAGTAQFGSPQGIATLGALDFESFTIGGRPMLAIANQYSGSSYDTNSFVYGWNAGSGQYVLNQTLATRGATLFESFVAGGEAYLLVANYASGTGTHATTSEMWRWSAFAGQFVSQQLIATVGAYGWTTFEYGGTTFAAYASYYTGSSHSSTSVVYSLNSVTRQLVPVTSVATLGARGVVSFFIGGVPRIAFAHHYTGSSYSTTSPLFRFNGTVLVREQSIATLGVTRMPVVWLPTTTGTTPLMLPQDFYDGSTYNLQMRTLEWRCRNDVPL
jgi:hypothetical protein